MTAFDANTFNHLCIVDRFGQDTTLRYSYARRELYIVKQIDPASKPVYERIAAVRCPTLVRIAYIADTSDGCFVCRPYITGECLADRLGDGGTLPEQAAVRIVGDVCSALGALHAAGLVHRDVNPNNILITEEGSARLIDYGIARAVSSDKPSDTVILGTPGYAAPEQFGFTQSDARTDIYAVGVLLNVLLTGKMPSEQIAEGRLGRIVRHCTRIDASRRYASVSEVSRALQGRVGSGADAVIAQIPGIRSRSAAVVVLSVFGYLTAALLTVSMFVASPVNLRAYLITFAVWLFLFVGPFVCFSDFLGVRERLPFTRGADKRNQRIVFSLLGTASILIGLFLTVRIPR